MHTNARLWRLRLLEHSVLMPATCLDPSLVVPRGRASRSELACSGLGPKGLLRSVAYEGYEVAYEVAYEEQRPWAKLTKRVCSAAQNNG